MSARPLRTASNVPGGAGTGRRSALHLTLPRTVCASIEHHWIGVVVSACVGGTHDDSVIVVWAAAGVASAASRAAGASRARTAGGTIKRADVRMGRAPWRNDA